MGGPYDWVFWVFNSQTCPYGSSSYSSAIAQVSCPASGLYSAQPRVPAFSRLPLHSRGQPFALWPCFSSGPKKSWLYSMSRSFLLLVRTAWRLPSFFRIHLQSGPRTWASPLCPAPQPTAVFTVVFPSLQAQHFHAHVFKFGWIYYVLPENPCLLLHFLANIPSSTWLLGPEDWGGPSLFPLSDLPHSLGPPILSAEFVFTVYHFLLQGIFPTQGSNPYLLSILTALEARFGSELSLLG